MGLPGDQQDGASIPPGTTLLALADCQTSMLGLVKVDDSVLAEVVTVVTARHEDLWTHGLVIALW